MFAEAQPQSLPLEMPTRVAISPIARLIAPTTSMDAGCPSATFGTNSALVATMTTASAADTQKSVCQL